MPLISIGLNHNTAPLAYREELSSLVQDIVSINTSLRSDGVVSEIVTISTCNRVEFYSVVQEESEGVLFERLAKLGIALKREFFYQYAGQEAVQHLFRVVSSLDSMILGENQIIAQVRSSFQYAEKSSSVGPILRRLFERAFIVAKKVRTNTKISEGAVSIGRAGVELSCQVLGDVWNKTAMIIGAGEHGQLIAKNLKEQGLSDLFIANRTFERASTIAKEIGAFPIPLEAINQYLVRCDMVISSVGGGTQIIGRSSVEMALKNRRYKPMVFMDLSVPRVFDLTIHELNDAYLFDVDDLKSITSQGAELRKAEAIAVEKIVKEEVAHCWIQLHSDQHNATIGEVFKNALQIVDGELSRIKAQTDLDDATLQVVEKAMNTAVKKILHNPIKHAQMLAKNNQTSDLKDYLLTLLGQVQNEE